jgi:hypothetical protein
MKSTSLNPLVTKEQLLRTPSFNDGISSELEKDLRIVGCDLIQAAGILLRLPQLAMSTAQVLFHRFYYVSSLRRYGILVKMIICLT